MITASVMHVKEIDVTLLTDSEAVVVRMVTDGGSCDIFISSLNELKQLEAAVDKINTYSRILHRETAYENTESN